MYLACCLLALASTAQDVLLSPPGTSVDLFAVSADGSTAVFTTRANPPDVYTVSLLDLEPVLRTAPGFVGPSVDRILVAPRSNAAVFWSALGNPPGLRATPLKAPGTAQVLDPGIPGQVTFGPKSGRVYYTVEPSGATSPELYSASVDGGRPPHHVNAPLTSGMRLDQFRISPDGQTIVYVERASGGVHRRRMLAVPAGGGPAIVLLDATSNRTTRLIAFTPDSSRLRFLHDGRVHDVPVDGSSPPVVLLDQLLKDDSVLSLSPDETGLVIDGEWGSSNYRALYFIDLVTLAPALELDSEVDSVRNVVWSPDSSWILYTHSEPDREPWSRYQLRSVSLDGSTAPVALSETTSVDLPFDDVVFQWTPTANDALWWELGGEVWSRNVFAAGRALRLTPVSAAVQRFVRTPDGRLVYSTNDHLYLLPEIAPVPPLAISAIDTDRFELTPEGRRVLYVRAGGLYLNYLTPPFLPHRR